MIEFRGVVNINDKGEIVCFCSQMEALQGKCVCKTRDNCPDAIITIEIISGTTPVEQGIRKVKKASKDVGVELDRIKQGLVKLEKAVKNTKFRL